MRPLWPRTIRAKLTLLSAVVMGVLLSILGAVVDLGARRLVVNEIDSSLSQRGEDIAQGHAAALRRFKEEQRPPEKLHAPPPPMFRTLRARFFAVETKLALPMDHEPPYSVEGLKIAKTGRENFRTVILEGLPVRVFSRPLREGPRVGAVVQLPYDLSDAERALEGLRRIMLVLIPVGVGLCVLASFFLIDRLMSPLRLMNRRAEAIGASSLEDRLPVVGQDEFASLGKTLNKMLDRLQRAFILEQETSRRLEASLEQQRRFTADASHELKTPLAVIRANTGLVRLDPRTPEQDEGLVAIDEAAGRMTRLVQDLLMLARMESGRIEKPEEPCLLAEVVRRAVRMGAPGSEAVKVAVEDEEAAVMGRFDDLVRMVQNLVNNALTHARASAITVTAGRRVIEVRDNGVGIPPEYVPRLFDRFVRVDSSRSAESGGSGLGLAIVKSIAEANGASVQVQSEVGKGSVFTVIFPS